MTASGESDKNAGLNRFALYEGNGNINEIVMMPEKRKQTVFLLTMIFNQQAKSRCNY
ncbi:hypothetical protein KMU_27320 [Proteus vulgaris]|nr:hypothetical protein KMU_27320 [Proteus vulgaris]